MDEEDKKDRMKQYMKEYYTKNRSKILTYRKEYYKKFPEKYKYNPVPTDHRPSNRVVINVDPNPPPSIFDITIE